MTGGTLTIPSGAPSKSLATNVNGHDQASKVASGSVVDWQQTTRGIAAGKSDCFQVYYEHYFDLMFRQARCLSGRDEQTCMDIVQDAMLKAIRSIKTISSEPALTAWTITVIKSTTYDWMRRQSREPSALTQLTTGSVEPGTNESRTPAEFVEYHARLKWIQDQLEDVEPELRKIISLRYRWGWTLNRIAKHLGVKTGAVDGRIRRAIEKLKRQAELESHE